MFAKLEQIEVWTECNVKKIYMFVHISWRTLIPLAGITHIKRAWWRGQRNCVFISPSALQIERNWKIKLMYFIICSRQLCFSQNWWKTDDDHMTHLLCVWVGRHLNDAVQNSNIRFVCTGNNWGVAWNAV